VFKKKLWSDAPFPDFEHLNAFESKFYCFGGDGGGNSGGGSNSNSNSNSEQNQRADAQEPIRGGRRAAAVPAPSLTPAAAQQSLDAKNPAVQDFKDRLAAGQFDAAPQSRVTAPPTRVPAGQPVSFVEPQANNVGIGTIFDYDRPSTASQTYEADTSLDKTTPNLSASSLANMVGIDTSTDIGGRNVSFGSTPGVSGLSGLNVDLGLGKLGIGTNLARDKYGIGYNVKFEGGGAVPSLLEPLGDYLGNQIDQQRVDPFLEMVENAAYQEFGIDPSSGGGGMGSVGFDLPGQMEPQVGGFETLETPTGEGFEALAYRRMEAEGGGEDLTRPMQLMKPQVQPNFMQSALGYFGETYDTFNTDTGMSSTAMTPELMVQRAQGRLMQRDMKPKAVTAYLNNIIQTGGNPTMMAPDMSSNMQQANLLGVGPGGGVSSGQALPSTNPYQAQLFSAFGGIGSLF